MTVLPRLKPEPLPAIQPVPEYAVEGRRKDWYEDMKARLQVPWMGVVTMAFAHYPRFFETLWQGLRPLVGSRPFVEACGAQRALAESGVAALHPPPLAARLREAGYGAREVQAIRDMLEIFSHGNQPYFLIATAARLLLEGDELTGRGKAPDYQGRHAPKVSVPFVLMERHHADEPTRALYDDIQASLGLPFVNTDYRALARWPSYFAHAWADLRPKLADPAYEALCARYHALGVGAVVGDLPNPGGIAAESLREAAAADARLEEVLAVARLFQWLLPGLAVNIAFFRAQLGD